MPVTLAAVDPDRQADIAALDCTLTTVERVLDVEGLRSRIEKLEHEASDPHLWDDQTRAQRVTSELSHTQGELRRVEELRRRLDDLPVLYELAAEEAGAAAADAVAEADAELKSLRADIEATEVRTLLSGEYDEREALVTIRSGAGGVDAADWAEMLMRMYIRWAEQHKYPVEVFDTSYAEEAGIKSATFAVHAPFAYGTLSVNRAPTGWCGSARSTTRAGDRRRSPKSKCCRWWRPPTTLTSPRAMSASTSIAPAGPAGNR